MHNHLFPPPETPEIEMLGTNRLTRAGNQAQTRGLIDGHGFYQGQYEILRQGQFLLMSPEQAQTYLEELLQNHG